MNPLPHLYHVTAEAAADGTVSLSAARVPALRSAAPAEFGGPGDRWSPETLLVAAVADCFMLTFDAVARASRLSWVSLSCDVEGTLDTVDRQMQFTAFVIRPRLIVPAGVNDELARRTLERTERACLVSNSLKARRTFDPLVEQAPAPASTE